MLNNHSKTWVIVADASCAKIYSIHKFPKMEEILKFEHPESRLSNRELTRSQPGRGFQRGGGVRYSYEGEFEPKQIESDKFAADLAEMLDNHRVSRDFGRLYLIAGPSFLGLLRKHLHPEVRKLIVAELDKELTSCSISDIEKHIAEITY